MTEENVRRDYWEENIGGFAGFYDRKSEERILAPAGLAWLYKRLLFPIEKRYMKVRYDLVSRYLERHVHEGTVAADVGCGDGIFTRMMVERGAGKVYALDFTESALELTRQRLGPRETERVTFIHSDISKAPIPQVEVAIAIGVLVYVNDVEAFFANVLPNTQRLLVNFVSADNLLNRIRRRLTVLDVRRLTYQRMPEIESVLDRYGFVVTQVDPLATGFVVQTERRP